MYETSNTIYVVLLVSNFTIIKNHLRQEELHSSCFIIYDMQFDQATKDDDNTTVIESCRKKFEALGYTMPRLIFWNVSVYAHNTIPVQMHHLYNLIA